MNKVYDHKDVEERSYKTWEEKGYFNPDVVNPGGKPFSIILPPPNANGNLHFGHAMYVIEDILVRYHRMKGDRALWLPGADHAGFETQFVFEKKLQAEGKSRTDFDRETLYQMIWEFTQSYRPVMENQLRKLGFSLDWSRRKFTLDPDVIRVVYKTFKKLYEDGLIYRGNRLVNYCTHCGTSFSDLEVNHKEQKDPLYYIKYGPFVIATVRPETKFGDSALAVHPDDKRYKQYIGKDIEFETLLGKKKMRVIADSAIDPKFGTGAMKVTPGHDMKDFEIGKRHNLDIIQVIGFDGKLNEKTGKYAGLYVKQARKKTAEDMEKMGLLEKVDENYTHTIEVCYKCGTTIEPMLLPQWFITMKPLAEEGIAAIKKRKVQFYPKRFERICVQMFENVIDWNISRQTVWGMRIPAWQCKDCKKQSASWRTKVSNNIAIDKSNNDTWIVTEGEKPEKCPVCGSDKLEQDPDTFDTWFSSGQWPFSTLKTTKPGDFEAFYPTSVMETGYDILRAWVNRMIMLGLYATGDVPFGQVILHGIVNDPYGKKMSKSKGNVVNPLELIDQYGADAVRMALVYGTAVGNDQALSYPKLDGMRKFTNKLWNIARFILDFKPENAASKIGKHEDDQWILGELNKTVARVTKALESYDLHFASDELYQFTWHTFADKYIEKTKDRRGQAQPCLEYVLENTLKLLHPFMPFVTEEIYQKLSQKKDESVMVTSWPKKVAFRE